MRKKKQKTFRRNHGARLATRKGIGEFVQRGEIWQGKLSESANSGTKERGTARLRRTCRKSTVFRDSISTQYNTSEAIFGVIILVSRPPPAVTSSAFSVAVGASLVLQYLDAPSATQQAARDSERRHVPFAKGRVRTVLYSI